MKRIFSLFMIMLFAVCSFAQTFTDNWNVGIHSGVVTLIQSDPIKNARPIIGVEVGKAITPVVGVRGMADITINTAKTNTVVSTGTLSVVPTINLTNLFCENHRWTIALAPGLGVTHTFGKGSVVKRNMLDARAGVDVNYNFGSVNQFALSLRPAIVWHDFANGGMNRHKANSELTLSFIYKFKNSNGTHGFKKCPYSVTADEYNAVVKELNILKMREPEKIKEVVVKEVVKEVPTLIQSTYVVTFAKNSAELTDANKAVLDKINSGSTVEVNAYSSPEGSKNYNLNLSEQRAKNIESHLSNRDIKVTIKYHGAVGDDSNRIAIISVQ